METKHGVSFAIMKSKVLHPSMQRAYAVLVEQGILPPPRGRTEGSRFGLPVALARLMGMHEQAVYRWETRGLAKEACLRLQREYRISADWLETGKGAPMLLAEPCFSESEHAFLNAYRSAPDHIRHGIESILSAYLPPPRRQRNEIYLA